MSSKTWDEIIYQFPNFHPTLYNGCNYLSMQGLKLNHVSRRGSWCISAPKLQISCIICLKQLWPGSILFHVTFSHLLRVNAGPSRLSNTLQENMHRFTLYNAHSITKYLSTSIILQLTQSWWSFGLGVFVPFNFKEMGT